MKKIILALVLISSLLLVAAIYLLLNLNNLVAGIKPRIEQVASEALGTSFTIKEISTSVFPDLKLSLRGVSAEVKQNEQGLGRNNQDKLAIHEVNLFIDLMGLLSGSLVVDELSVVAPQLSLIRDGQGMRLAGIGSKVTAATDITPLVAARIQNDLPQDKQQIDKTSGDTDSGTDGKGTGVLSKLPVKLALEGLRIQNGSVKVFDISQTSGTQTPLELKDINLITAASFQDGIVRLKGLDSGITVFASEKLGLGCDLLSFDLNSQKLLLVSPMILKFADERLEVAGELEMSKMRGQLAISSDGIEFGKLSGIISGFGQLFRQPKLTSLDLKGQIKPQLSIMLNGANIEPSFSGDIGLGAVGFRLINSDGVSNSSLQDLTTVLKVEGTTRDIKIRSSRISLSVASSGFRAALPVNLELTNLSADTNLTPLAARVELPHILVTADNQQVKVGANLTFKDRILKVTNFNFAGFSGSLVGDLELNTANNSFANKAKASKIKLAELLKFAIGNSASLTGEISYLTCNLSGRLDQDLFQTLQGGAEVGLANLSLKGFNLLREVLSELKSLPFMSGALLGKVPAELQASVNSDSTPLDEVMLRVNLQSGRGAIRTLNAKSLLFDLVGEGEINLLNNRLNLQTDFSIKPPMSIGLAERVKELRPLLNEQQLLVFPLRIDGVPPKVVVYPDPSKLLEKIGRKILQQKGQKLLKGLLGF